MSMFIVKTSAVPAKIGRYVRHAVLEVPEGTDPGDVIISERCKRVLRIVETWERQSMGKTDRCAAARSLKEAQALCAKLNAEKDAEFGSGWAYA